MPQNNMFLFKLENSLVAVVKVQVGQGGWVGQQNIGLGNMGNLFEITFQRCLFWTMTTSLLALTTCLLLFPKPN